MSNADKIRIIEQAMQDYDLSRATVERIYDKYWETGDFYLMLDCEM
jgi:hypothetical protein